MGKRGSSACSAWLLLRLLCLHRSSTSMVPHHQASAYNSMVMCKGWRSAQAHQIALYASSAFCHNGHGSLGYRYRNCTYGFVIHYQCAGECELLFHSLSSLCYAARPMAIAIQSSSSESSDTAHYTAPLQKPESKSAADAIADVATVIQSASYDNFEPAIQSQSSNYLYSTFKSPTFGFVDDVEGACSETSPRTPTVWISPSVLSQSVFKVQLHFWCQYACSVRP